MLQPNFRGVYYSNSQIMKVKKYIFSIILSLSICVSGLFGFQFFRAETLTANAKTVGLQTQFVDSVIGMQYTLGNDSPIALIPLVDELGGMMLLIRVDADKQAGGFDKNKLASLMFKLISENSYLAVDTESGMQYIVNKDNSPAFDLQPLFDLITEGFEDMLKVAVTDIENGAYTRQCDIGDMEFADSEQQSMYSSDLGMEFSRTTLYYFGTSQRAAAVDLRMTVAGSQDPLSKLHDVAKSFNKNFLINRLYFDYKELNLNTQQLVGDVYFDASIDCRRYPEQIAVFACSAAYVTSDEDLKLSLISAVNQYLSDGGTDALKSAVGDIGSTDGFNSIYSFASTSFDEVLKELNIRSDVLLQTAEENRYFVAVVKKVIDLIPDKDRNSTLGQHEKKEGAYVFDFETAIGESVNMAIDLTVNLFEPSTKDLSALIDKIAYVRKLDKSKYTEESWSALYELLERVTLLDENSTQSEIDEAVFKLERAISQLALLPPAELSPPDLTWLYILLPVVVVIAGSAVVLWLIIARKRKYVDNTPMVEYDIDEDCDFDLLFGDVSGLDSDDDVSDDADGGNV